MFASPKLAGTGHLVWFVVVVAGLAVSSPARAQTSPEAAGGGLSERLLEEADAISQRLGSVRGLKPLGPITKGVKDRAQLRESLIAKIAVEYPKEEILAEQAMMVRLGLMRPDQDLESIVLDVLTEEIAGYYDTDVGELYLIDDPDMAAQRMTMAHELFHAIQDQHYHLNSVQGPKTGLAGTKLNPDRVTARASLIEGDAVVVMLDFTLAEQGVLPPGQSVLDQPAMADMVLTQLDSLATSSGALFEGQESALERAPRFIQMELQFPYIAGLSFVRAVREANGSWADVNAVYLDPPNSTEQILHPERYLDRDEPVLIDLDEAPIQAALPGDGWEMFYASVVGEYRTRLWLEEHLEEGSPIPIPAAAGWDGDRLKGFMRDGHVVAVQVSVWDSAAEAKQYAEALVQMSRKRRPGSAPFERSGAHGELVGLGMIPGEELTLVERWGAWVLYIDGVPVPSDFDLGALRSAVWQGRRAGPYPKTKTGSPSP